MGSQQSQANSIGAGLRPSPTHGGRAEQGIPPCGIGSKKPAHEPVRDPGPTARDTTNDNNKNGV